MASLTEWINRVRTLDDLPLLQAVQLEDTERDDEDNCVLACALQRPVGPSGEDRWVIRYRDRLAARRVGIVLGLDWTVHPPTVALPSELIDLVVAQHRGYVEADEVGDLAGWWAPRLPDPRPWLTQRWQYLTPFDEGLAEGEPWQLPGRPWQPRESP